MHNANIVVSIIMVIAGLFFLFMSSKLANNEKRKMKRNGIILLAIGVFLFITAAFGAI